MGASWTRPRWRCGGGPRGPGRAETADQENRSRVFRRVTAAPRATTLSTRTQPWLRLVVAATAARGAALPDSRPPRRRCPGSALAAAAAAVGKLVVAKIADTGVWPRPLGRRVLKEPDAADAGADALAERPSRRPADDEADADDGAAASG